MRKKLFTFLLALAASVGMSWATVITWDQSKVSSMAMNVLSGSDSRTSDGITVTAVNTGEFVLFGYDGAIEIGNGEGSGGGYLTFTSSVGNIAQIDINHSGAGEWRNANGDWISPYYENFEGGIFRWSGTPAASITLTGDAPRHIDGITSIEFTIEDGGGSSTPATGLQVVEVTSDIYNGWNSNGNTFSVNALPGFQAVTFDEAKAWTEVPTSGTAVLVYRTNGDYARVIHFFDGTISGDYDLETDFNQMYENITLFGNRIFYTAGGSTPTPDPDPTPTPSATGVIFANCYDCWRSPDYPKISGQCYLHSFADPRVGNNKPSGPWKLEFVENYNSSSTEYDSDIVKNAVANEYYKTPAEMEVYRLYQWQNGAYQPVAYGVLYAYANENNQVEHAAFFEADGFWGCYLTDNTHSNGDNINILFNEDASTGFADLHGGSTPDPDPTPTPSGDGGKLLGAFSVSGTKVVYFSKGNLQATTNDQGATWTWGFAENQWDYVGDNAANTSFDYWGGTGNGSYDLFGWIGESSALTDYRQYGIGSNYDFTDYGNTAGEDLKADWGSLMGSDWRTLTYDEWQYLIKSRNNAANLRAYATVNGKTGLILLPDSWTSSSVALTITTANYTTNIISASDWSTLEEQGCVFLPAAGWRSDDSVSGVGEGGDYWSSSSPSGKQYDEGSAYCFFFDTDFSKQADGMHFNKRGRGYGLSVRLVSETAPSPAPAPAGLQVTELQISASWENDQTLVTISDLPGFVAVSLEEAGAWDAVPAGDVVLIYAGTNEGVTATYFHNGAWGDPVPFGGFSRADIFEWASGSKIFYTSGGSTPAVDPAVQNVIDLINAIPNPVVYNQDCYNALEAARSAYIALSEEQRDQVTNYNDYLAAEEMYYMLADVNYVIEKINEIGDVEFTPACKHRIDYARSEYCSLTLEQKGYVTNYNTLLAAEAAYAALIPVSSTVVWDESILATINVDELGEATYTNGSISLKAVDGRAHYVDIDDHFIFDGMNSEKSFVFSCTSANILCIEITVSEKHQHNELSCAWQETATGYRWVGEATSVDFASTIFKVTGIRFSLGEAFPEPTPTPAQDGDKLPGAFSVDGGKVVYFSKGNLQYLGNIERWHFAENQWTIIGNAQASNNRDLFSWGTGDNPESEDYSTYTEWGNNIEGNWRTLTVEEWTYLFNTRTDASSKYGTATVAGVEGLILLPDVYDGTAINTERTAWNNNVISSSEWAAYEAEGAVFLPAAGLSDAYDVYGVGEQGFYWSSTMDALSHHAISVFYGFDGFEGYWFNQVDAQFQPQEGHSVRLVSETAPTPAPVGPTYLDADFAIDFRTDPYTVVGGGALPTGVEVAGDFHDAQHGYSSPVITIPVTAGNYLVKMGACQFSNQDGSVKNEDGTVTYTTLATNTGVCYDADPSKNYVADIITIPTDQIIKVYGAEYTPFFSIEKMPEIPAFTDFELNFQTDPYNMISGAKPEGTVIAGSFHDDQHGYQNVEATVPVKAGKYRLTLGACEYDSNAGTVMSETNVELASFNQNLGAGKCYHNNTTKNIVSVIFDVDQDQTITIDCGQYTPYMKLEAVTSYAVEFALGDAEGVAPAALDVTIGEDITMPVNKTMYKEGYTLTGWSDGVNTYAIGESFTPANDAVLTPVFTANEADLLNASTDVTVKWYFGGDNGAPVMHLEGSAGLLVAQATIGDKTVDVKLSIDATSGKFVPQPTTEWAQVRVGTIFTYPYKEGMTVDVHTYSGNVTYYVADGNVTCGTNDYYSFIEVTYPASAPTTAVKIGDPNDADQVTAFLNTYEGQTIDELIIDRPVLNNMYNTLCLPFDMNAAQIAASSLNGVEIREFTGASVEGTTLNLSVGDPVNAVVAGRPYFVKYSAASQLDDLHFEDVTINNALLDNMAVTFDGVTFKGTFTPFLMPNGLNFQGGYLFLGQNNQLFWPNTSNPLKPFRAYFYVDVESSTPGNAPKYRGMPARIVEGKNVATGVENAQSANQSTKVIVNGQLIIIKNDVRYNAQGQIVK